MTGRKTAVITGSSGGIGLGIARGLAGVGMNIVLNGIEPEAQIEPVRRGLETEFGVKVTCDRANLMDPAGVLELMTGAEANFGNVDMLVNNAGIQFVALIEDFPDEKWQAILNLNLSAAFYSSKAVVPASGLGHGRSAFGFPKTCGWPACRRGGQGRRGSTDDPDLRDQLASNDGKRRARAGGAGARPLLQG